MNSKVLATSFKLMTKSFVSKGLHVSTLKKSLKSSRCHPNIGFLYPILMILISILMLQFTQIRLIDFMVKYALGTRCFIPNNYFIWESTRPVSDCSFCTNVTKVLILPNVTRSQFYQYAYQSRPILIKGGVQHWPAMKVFNFNFFKNLYETIDGAYESVNDNECQFLHFQSNFVTIQDVFRMSESRAKNLPGEKPWYIGLGNCHPKILQEMRKYYPRPHFLPKDAEIPNRDYIFFGYNEGATMHLDYISRLMWQAQISGNKTWNLIPTPECESQCSPIQFYVEPGDAVLLDTRIWYHSTTNAPNQFSLTLQSEYG